MPHTVFHTCSLCEATCGLTFEVEDNQILSVRPDDDDVFSRGYVCPKGIAIADIHADPDRPRRSISSRAASARSARATGATRSASTGAIRPGTTTARS